MNCAKCGTPSHPNDAFCGRCGAALPGLSMSGHDDGIATPSAATPSTSGLAAEAGSSPGRRFEQARWVLFGTTVVAVVLIGAALLIVMRADGGDVTSTPSVESLPAPLLETPREQWRVDFDLDPVAVEVVGDAVVALEQEVGSNFELRALSLATGDERWSADIDFALEEDEPVSGDIYAVAGLLVADLSSGFANEGFDSTRVVAFDLTSGEQEWSRDFDGAYTRVVGDDLFVHEAGPNRLNRLDLTSGEPLWRAHLSRYEATGERIVGLDGDQLVAIDSASGDQRWSVEIDLDDASNSVSMFVSAGVVAVTPFSSSDVTAYDVDSGQELWHHRFGDFNRVRTAPGVFILIRNTDGIEVVEAADGAYRFDVPEVAYGMTFGTGPQSYLLLVVIEETPPEEAQPEEVTYELYDLAGDRVGSFVLDRVLGQFAVAEGAIYTRSDPDGELAALSIPDLDEVWSVDVDGDFFKPIDRGLLMWGDGELALLRQ